MPSVLACAPFFLLLLLLLLLLGPSVHASLAIDSSFSSRSRRFNTRHAPNTPASPPAAAVPWCGGKRQRQRRKEGGDGSCSWLARRRGGASVAANGGGGETLWDEKRDVKVSDFGRSIDWSNYS